MQFIKSSPPGVFGFSAAARLYGLYQITWREIIKSDPRMHMRVLDVGSCVGPEAPEQIEVVKLAAHLDAVDPDKDVLTNPYAKEKWVGFLEDAPVPENTYDGIISYTVFEHVADPERFLKAAHKALKPGGVMYATTPHLWHHFPWIVRFLDVTRLKPLLAKHVEHVNEYPSYYKLNSAGIIRKWAIRAGFSRAEVMYHPARVELYMPKAVRFTAYAYDWLLGYRFRSFCNQIMIKLEK